MPSHPFVKFAETSSTNAQKPAQVLHGTRPFHVELGVPVHGLSDAVDKGDDSTIWRMYRECESPHLFLDWLSNLICSTVSRVGHPRDSGRVVEMMHTLFLVPVLLPPTTPLDTASPQEQLKVAMAIRQELETWWGAGSSVTLHRSLVRYRDLSLWGPSSLRQLVTALARQPAANGSPLPLSPSRDNGAPELTFVVGCAHRWLAYPETPEPDAWNDGRLRELLAGHLGFLTNRALASTCIGRPALVCDAVLNGLGSWLTAVTAEMQVSSWQIFLEREDISRLKLYSPLEEHEISIPVRLHQIGLHGLDLLVAQLSEIAGSCVSEGAGTPR